MIKPIFSASWYRVAGLIPRLRSHAQIHRHDYRGQIWYVLQDHATGRFHRFPPSAHTVIGLMDGQRTVQKIWDSATEKLSDDAPTQDEMIALLSQLHAAEVLQCDVTPDAAELLERHQRQQRRLLQGRLLNPLAVKIPLVDPESWLQRLLPIAQPLFGKVGFLLWIVVIGAGVVLASIHWAELTHNVLDVLLTPKNALYLWLLFPVLKALHEFGHAFAVKAFGGEVHDMGVMLLVFTPVPYVDASSSSALRSKWQRITIGAAGMAVELFLASLALFVWVNAEPGVVRTLAYDAMMIGGISTLLFNVNPLLRYDGYYMLADFLEIPNLSRRSNVYLGYLCERYLLGQREAEAPEATAGERAWFVVYAISSFFYRLLVIVAILIFIGKTMFMLGLILAVIAGIAWIGVPAAKGLSFLFTSPRLRRVRARALATSAAAMAALLAFVTLVPLPWRSRADGVIWMPEESLVRAGTEGFVEQVLVREGARVSRGDLLVILRDPELSSQIETLVARVRELQARYDEAWAACHCPLKNPAEREASRDLVKAEMINEELRYARRSLERAHERATNLTVRSASDGTFVVPPGDSLQDRFFKQGELLAHVIELSKITVRAVISQADMDLVQSRTRQVQVRLAEHLSHPIPAAIKRIVPAASEELPSTALGSEGGGEIAVSPLDSRGLTAMQKIFEIDLEVPSLSGVVNVGGRAHIRFDHGWETLAVRWYRSVRLVFLSQFNI